MVTKRYTDLPISLGMVALYVLLSKMAMLAFAGDNVVSFLWLAGGVSLVVVFLRGYKYFPAIFLGALLGNLLIGAPLDFSVTVALRHTIAIFFAIWLLNRVGHFDPTLSTLEDYLRILLLALAVGLISATLMWVLELLGANQSIEKLNYYQRWMGNTLGAMIVMPLILIWLRLPRGWRASEASLILGLSFLIGQVVFLDWLHDSLGEIARGYWMFPLITWAAVRLGPHGTVLLLAVTAIQGLAGAQSGAGFFAEDIAKTQLANYAFYMLSLSVVGMALTTYFAQMKQASRELDGHRQHLEDLVKSRTEQIETLNVDLQARALEAEAANRAKTTFLANMSHELRTPLNAILGFADILRRDARLTESQKETLEVIQRSGDHLLGLINDVLDIAKIEAGRLLLKPIPFDLGGMIASVTNMLRVRAEDQGLTFLVDQSSTFPRYVVADEAKLRQILINLIGNAIKATEKGCVTLHLNVSQDDICQLLIEVEDTGVGISPTDQAKLFQPFVQIGLENSQKGTGLGLAITRQFVELMGGEISLSSELRRGSIFRAVLPVRLPEADEIPQVPKARGDVTNLEPGQTLPRMLIVEDQLQNQILMRRLLEDVGFDVQLAENGAEAVEQFGSWKPDFIWMDRRMPVMDGIEATQRIRALPGGARVKIVAVTASSFRDEVSELIAAGFDDIVHKPFRSEQLFECLERLLALRFVRTGPQEPIAPKTSSEKIRVLIVDDDEDQRLLTRLLLEKSRFELREAANGKEAIAIFQEWNPQLILQDMHMPGMDGSEVTRQIRSLPGGDKTRIIALTAGAEAEECEEYSAAGCNDVVFKPVELEKMLALSAKYFSDKEIRKLN